MPIRIGFLTAPEWPELTVDDKLVSPYLAHAGIEVVPAIWTQPLPPNLDILLMRSTWGYFRHIDAFRDFLTGLADLAIPVYNPVEVLLDNLDKRYLLRLKAHGHAIVPTRLLPAGSTGTYAATVAETGWPEVILKPAISAAGHETHRQPATQALPESLARLNVQADLLIQPFCPAIQTEGEWSLIFFNGHFSHCVLKRPGPEHFLVHEEHGGKTTVAVPPPELLTLCQRVVSDQCNACLYVRVDCVRRETGFAIMELELLEPALYLRHESGAAARWAQAVKQVSGDRF